MKPEPFDHAPAVKDWLEEPVWLPESDLGRLAAIVHQTPQQRRWLPTFDRGSFSMSTVTTFVVAGAIAALVGGYVLSGAVTLQPDQPLPIGAGLTSPSPAVQAESPGPTESDVASTGSVTIDGTVVMGAPSGASVGGWTEIGRTPMVSADGPSLNHLRDLSVVGDQLFAVGRIEETSEGPSRQVLLRSADGLTWTPVALPGTDPVVTALAHRSGGLLAGGSEVREGDRAGGLWTSPDGLTWTPLPGPPFAEVGWIVSAEAPLVVIDGSDRPYVWVSANDGDDWSTSRRLNDFSIARGPGGFLMWRGGGQDEMVPTRLLLSADATDFREVELPAALTDGDDAFAGVSVFALDDAWVLVPSEVKLPDTIYTSTDGITWAEAPRPTRMTEDVRWVATVGDETQAFGFATAVEAHPSDLVPTPKALWAWQVGGPAPEPTEVDQDGDDLIWAPVAFGDGYLAIGLDGGRDSAVTVWRYEPPATS